MRARTDRRSGERRQWQRRALDARAFPDQVYFSGIWHGSAEVIGYATEAADGPIGRVADFSIEEESAVVTEIVVMMRRPLRPKRRLFIPLNAIKSIDEQERKIYLWPTRDELGQWSKSKPRC
jgi:hypothetical protein